MCEAGQATKEGFQANTPTVKGTAQAFEKAGRAYHDHDFQMYEWESTS